MPLLLLLQLVVLLVAVAHRLQNVHFVSFGCLGVAVNHISLVVAAVVAVADKLAAEHKLLSKCAYQDTSVFQCNTEHHKHSG